MHITTTREIEAVRIPSGEAVTLPVGTEVVVTQSLGGSFTVVAPQIGSLFRVRGADADAIGQSGQSGQSGQASTDSDPATEPGEFSDAAVWAQLRTCFDPEIPVNIVDLGLIYSMVATEKPEGRHVDVAMTLTAPGCGMGPMIAADAREKILSLPGVATAEVQVVWEPQWTPDRISPEGKKILGIES